MSETTSGLLTPRLYPVAHLKIEGLRDAVWSPDGTAFAVAASTGVWWQDVMQAHEPRLITQDKNAFNIASDPRGPLLALGSGLTIQVVDSLTGARRAPFGEAWGTTLLDLVFSPDGRWLASIDDSCVAVADLEMGGVRLLSGSGGTMAWSGDGGILAYPTWDVGKDGAIALWERETGTVQRFIEVDEITLEDLACSPTAPLLAAGFTDGSVRVWNLVTGAEQPVLRQEDWVVDTAFSPDGSFLAVHGESGTTRLWDMRTGELCAAEPTGAGFRVLFSSTGSQIAIVNGRAGTLSVWGLGA